MLFLAFFSFLSWGDGNIGQQQLGNMLAEPIAQRIEWVNQQPSTEETPATIEVTYPQSPKKPTIGELDFRPYKYEDRALIRFPGLEEAKLKGFRPALRQWVQEAPEIHASYQFIRSWEIRDVTESTIREFYESYFSSLQERFPQYEVKLSTPVDECYCPNDSEQCELCFEAGIRLINRENYEDVHFRMGGNARRTQDSAQEWVNGTTQISQDLFFYPTEGALIVLAVTTDGGLAAWPDPETNFFSITPAIEQEELYKEYSAESFRRSIKFPEK